MRENLDDLEPDRLAAKRPLTRIDGHFEDLDGS
jgi:hypothetical protein